MLESIRETGEQDTNWNFRTGYALYYLDRNKEALSYFTKADVLIAKRMGKRRIIAETGTGQHDVATAKVCALINMLSNRQRNFSN